MSAHVVPRHSEPEPQAYCCRCVSWCQRSEIEWPVFQALTFLAWGYNFDLKTSRAMCIAKWGWRVLVAYLSFVQLGIAYSVGNPSWRLASLNTSALARNVETMPGLGSPEAFTFGGAKGRVQNAALNAEQFLVVVELVCFWLTNTITVIFMAYWTDSSMQFIQERFLLFKQRRKCCFLWLFWLYMVAGTVMWLVFGIGRGMMVQFYQIADADQAFYDATKAALNGTEPSSEQCCAINNGWMYKYLPLSPIPTGNIQTGITILRFMETLMIYTMQFQVMWCSATWIFITVMFWSEYTHSVASLSWSKIHKGEALREYLFLVDKVTHLSRQWDIKNSIIIITHMANCVASAVTLAFKIKQPGGTLGVGTQILFATLPILNLFLDLLAGGYITDTISRVWLRKLKEMELEDLLGEHVSALGSHKLTRGLHARANQYHPDRQPLITADSLLAEEQQKQEKEIQNGKENVVELQVTRPDSPAARLIRILEEKASKQLLEEVLPLIVATRREHSTKDCSLDDHHDVHQKCISQSTQKHPNLNLLKVTINTYRDQAAITVCNFFRVTTGTVVAVFLQLFGFVALMVGLFLPIEEDSEMLHTIVETIEEDSEMLHTLAETCTIAASRAINGTNY